MPSDFERRAIRRLIDQAKQMGLGGQIPPVVQALADGHGPSNGGALGWVRLHPDDDEVRGCCWGEAEKGPEYCECWAPVFDLEQADPIMPGEGEIQVRTGGMCGDCAYRPDSPERAEDFLADALRELPLQGQTFWCHDGMRRPARWEHPDGRVVPGDPTDYQPAMVRGIPFRADGRVGALCAGWAACGRWWDKQIEKEEASDRA